MRAGTPPPFLLVHGAWHGGWCWQALVGRLAAAGHRVFAPTLAGLGERAGLISDRLTLDGYGAEICRLIEAEDLRGLVLVGHSFGGAVALGVADRLPERIRHLVLLDAMILEDGQSPFDAMEPQVAAERRLAVRDQGGGIALPVPPVGAFGIDEAHPDAAFVRAQLTPHPASTCESPLHLQHGLGNGLPCSYIQCTSPSYSPLSGSRARARARPGWNWLEIATGHDAMITAPDALADILTSRCL